MIINNTPYTFSPSEQQTIENAMANAGLDKVEAHTNKSHNEVDGIFNFFDSDKNYQFSIDVDGEVIFENHFVGPVVWSER